MAPRRAANASHQSLYCWDPIFDSQRKVSARHDEPFVDVRNTLDTTSDLLDCFMQAFDENDSCHHATDQVVGFCRDTNLHGLQHDTHATSDLVALLDDSGGLTASDLYRSLRSPKIARGTHMYIKNGHIHSRKGADGPEHHRTKRMKEQKERIRRLYIATLNRWTVLALAATAPNHQAAILGEFIFNHLQLDPRINAKVSRDGLSVFALEFHFPYFALRRNMQPQRDDRKVANGNTLRQCQDIRFLREMGDKLDNDPTEYIYEAQVSCLVSGLSCYSWSAYLFNDLYFEVDEYAESIAEYHDQESVGLMLDPFTAGKKPRDALPRDPREYFLIICEVRLRKVTKELQQLFTAVDENIQAYKKSYSSRSRRVASCIYDDQHSCSDSERQRSQLRDELQEWMERSVELLRKFIGALNQYSEEWEAFRATGCNYFMSTSDIEQRSRMRKSLAAVNQQFAELRRLQTKFKHTMDRLGEDMSRNFSHRIAHESNESAIFQRRTAKVVQVLAWVTFISLPFALAASLLSTQEGYLPITPSPWALMTLIVILEALIWPILGSLLGWNSLRTIFKWKRRRFGIRGQGIGDVESQQSEGLG